ncbi:MULTISPECIES: metallophosphoesterase [Terrabacteria group]|uniref:metallophosphoesterase family protein n=1 Tax=Bacillati TaxID=1783272 RepID=UPI001C6F5808|nr:MULTISPECIES: YfcE family phosphodiesterase [Terrabacteria group]MBW9213036.1 YfcE family phosphodiesterase [Trueperella sp. zg.1013]
MQEIIVVSDNHGEIKNCLSVQTMYPNAIYIHCGDTQLSLEETPNFIQVKGNNDDSLDLPKQRIVKIEGLKILVCHGDKKPYPIDEFVAKEAKQLACALACYGHTHIPSISHYQGVDCVNPGSSHPYGNRDMSEASYAYIVIDQGKIMQKEIRRFDK